MFVPQNKRSDENGCCCCCALAKEYVPEQVNIAYGATKLILDVLYFPFDPR
jgi:hypothetical protein